GDEPQVLVLAAPANVLQPGEQPRRDVPAGGQVRENLPGVRLLDGGEHRDPAEPLVAEGQEVGQPGPGAAAQGVVDEGALEVEREHFDTHPSESLPRRTARISCRAGWGDGEPRVARMPARSTASVRSAKTTSDVPLSF